MKKIALFIGSLYGGGAERVTSNLANYLSQKGYGVEILVMSETKEIYHIDKNIKLNFLLKVNERKNFLINNIMRLYRLCCFLIREKDVDLFIVMLPETINLLLGLSFLTNAKIVASERNDMSKYSQKLQNSLKRKAKKADGYVFQTDDARKGYGDSINDIKTIVIPNAIDYSFIRPTYKGKRDKVIVGVGRLSAQKNFELLINAFSEIAKEFDEYQLIIYGEGNEREELETLSSSLGIRERVQLPGNVTNLAEKIEKAEVFVLSSDFEGMPNALIEAMALGLPCIATDCPVGGPKALIDNGINGMLVPVRDKDAMANALRNIITDNKKADMIGKEAAKITKKLSPEIIYGQWEDFINEIIGEKVTEK